MEFTPKGPDGRELSDSAFCRFTFPTGEQDTHPFVEESKVKPCGERRCRTSVVSEWSIHGCLELGKTLGALKLLTIYLGLLVAQLGMIIALGEMRVLIFAYGIDRLLKNLPLEEAALRKEYPMEYEHYSRRVRKLVPYVW